MAAAGFIDWDHRRNLWFERDVFSWKNAKCTGKYGRKGWRANHSAVERNETFSGHRSPVLFFADGSLLMYCLYLSVKIVLMLDCSLILYKIPLI